jgi:hypothetical protein
MSPCRSTLHRCNAPCVVCRTVDIASPRSLLAWASIRPATQILGDWDGADLLRAQRLPPH